MSRETQPISPENALITMWTNRPPPPPREVEKEPAEAGDGVNFYRAAHRALRGRYRLFVVLALAGAITGGVLGFRQQKAVYRSEGLVRIAFKRAALSDEAEKQRQASAHQEFLKSQVQVMTSQRVIDRAMEKWNARPCPATAPATRPQSRLSTWVSSIEVPASWKRTAREWLPARPEPTPADRARMFAESLTVLHPPETEHLLVYFADPDPAAAAAGVNTVIEAYQETRRFDNRPSAVADAQKEGEAVFQKELAQLQSLEREIGRQFDPDEVGEVSDGHMQRTGRSADELLNIGRRIGERERDPETAALTLNQIGVLDPLMREYLGQRQALQFELQRLQMSGAMKTNPRMIMLNRMIESHNETIEQYAEDFRKFQMSKRNPLSPVAAGAVDARHRLAELRLTEVDRHATELKTGGTFAGSAAVITAGVVPTVPFKDNRAKFAAAGAVLGAGLPGGLLVLWGMTRRRRLRTADDVSGRNGVPRLLGILPQLPRGRLSATRQSVWTFCVHQVRVMLQAAGGNRERPGAYLVTSTVPGEGKTQLTLALGRSFAQSGFRTLLIDCDLIAQGLTRRLRVEPGHDLIDALTTGSLKGCLRSVDNTGLAVLPVRSGVSVDGLCGAALRRLLDEARRHFDVVLVDSGSAVSSIEAALVAPEVDGVILTVTRGQERPVVEKCVQHLERIGGRIVGTVFNRARFANIQVSVPSRSGTPLLPAPAASNGNGNGNGNGHAYDADGVDDRFIHDLDTGRAELTPGEGRLVLASGIVDVTSAPSRTR